MYYETKLMKDSRFDRLDQFQQPEKIQNLVLNDNRIGDLQRNAFLNCRMINLQKVRDIYTIFF